MVKITQLKDREDILGRIESESLLEIIDHIVRRKSPMYLWIRFGAEEGNFYFRDGKMIYASSRSLRGKASAYYLLAFRSGIFRIVRGREPEAENVEIDWQEYKNFFLEELQKLVLNFLPDIEGKFIIKVNDFKCRDIFSHMDSGSNEQINLLNRLFQLGADSGFRVLIRGLEQKIDAEDKNLFASIYYIPELRYYVGTAGEKWEQKVIHKWMLKKFIPLLRNAVSIALRRADRRSVRAGILAIIPDKELATQIELALTSAGFKVWICQDGFEGLVRVEDYRPDLIIVHYAMERIRADEVYARLKRKEESQLTPIISLVPEVLQKNKDTPSGDIYCELPFSAKKLCKMVENLLELK